MAFQNKSKVALKLIFFKTHLSPLINTLCLYNDDRGRNVFLKVRGKADTTEASQVQRTAVTQESLLRQTGLLLQVQRGHAGK